MRVNLIAHNNGIGLSSDIRMLAGVLTDGGIDVTISLVERDSRGRKASALKTLVYRLRKGLPLRRSAHPPFDVNVMIERIRPHYLSAARINVLLPHPEWFVESDHENLAAIDVVLAKTRHAVEIFERLGKRTQFVGFSGNDRLLADVPRERSFFHLAGGSDNKGTRPLLDIWQRHPEWPRLTVLQSARRARERIVAPNIDHRIDYLSDQDLRRLQNTHAFHLCPSETEGYGHYIVEALSVGAVVVSVDAPPMNELVTPEHGILAPFARTGTQRLATTYFFDDEGMEATIERLLALPDVECNALGRRARGWYEQNDRAFRSRIVEALHALA
jgi:hypothetical protein